MAEVTFDDHSAPFGSRYVMDRQPRFEDDESEPFQPWRMEPMDEVDRVYYREQARLGREFMRAYYASLEANKKRDALLICWEWILKRLGMLRDHFVRNESFKTLFMLVLILQCLIYRGPIMLMLSINMILITHSITRKHKELAVLDSMPFAGLSIASPMVTAFVLAGSMYAINHTTVFKTIVSKSRSRQVVEHSSEGWTAQIGCLLAQLSLDVFGATYGLRFLAKPDLNRPVMDSYGSIINLELAQAVQQKLTMRNLLVSMVAISTLSFYVVGPYGLIISSVIGYSIYSDGNRLTKSTLTTSHMYARRKLDQPRIHLEDGVYAVTRDWMGTTYHKGIAYIEDGTLYTRFHVTKGGVIKADNGMEYKPCYSNEVTDNVAYGKSPRYCTPKDGQEVTVALAGPCSSALHYYRTNVLISDDGMMIFRGSKSIPGSSGSPAFVVEEIEASDGVKEGITRKTRFIGCLGWYNAHDSNADIAETNYRTGTELIASERGSIHTNFFPSVDGEITQVFKHPGSGKTRTIIPGLIQNATFEGKRVVISGPTRVVCRELYAALEEQFPGRTKLFISGANEVERAGHDVLVMAHATLLNMVLTNKINPKGNTLFVLDEAHFADPKTLCLKDFLRHCTKSSKKASLVELTATGYDFRAKAYINEVGSNYPITDIRMDERSMIMDALEKAKEGKKVMVFVSAVEGKHQTTAKAIEAVANSLGIDTVILSRKTFDTNYKKVKQGLRGPRQGRIILSTDISECGANFDLDYVYDFQVTMKPVSNGSHIYMSRVDIDLGQRTQRRGRVGRTKVGHYVSPGKLLTACNLNRAEHVDRKMFAETFGLDILDPAYQHPTIMNLSPGHMRTWAHYDEAHNSPTLYRLYISLDENGVRAKDVNLLSQAIHSWALSGEVQVRVNDEEVSVAFWDDRDKVELANYLAVIGKVQLRESDTRPTISKLVNSTTRHVMSALSTYTKSTRAQELRNIEEEEEEQRDETPLGAPMGIKAFN